MRIKRIVKVGGLFFMLMTFAAFSAYSQEKEPAQIFWENLQKHCGKAYEGRLADGIIDPDFEGHRLVMHVRSCDANTIRIPLFLGEDRSRTWVLTYRDGVISLKHDHRLEDGSEDDFTQYGGKAANTGFADLQYFPADPETVALKASLARIIWYMTLDEKQFTYNLDYIGSDEFFSIEFDLTRTVEAPPAPWGWED